MVQQLEWVAGGGVASPLQGEEEGVPSGSVQRLLTSFPPLG